MRNLVFRLATIAGVLFTLGACADSPTQSDRAPDLAGPAQDEQVVTPQGCVSDGLCVLPPISGGWCEPWMELDWDCDDGGGECMTSVGDPTDPEGSVGVQSCPGGGDTGGGGGGGSTPPPGGTDPGDEPCIESDTGSCSPVCEIDCEPTTEDNSICPQPLEGRTLTTLVNVAGRNHEFQFTGTMKRVNPLVGRSPAWYKISGPTASEDTWWIAESGNSQLVCWGRWHFRASLWLGTVYVNATDLHMVMGPGHPDF